MHTIIIRFLKKNFLIVWITLLAVFLRFVAIESAPPSLNWDEVSHGFNAYSILKTGKDEWGFTLPTIFRAYGDYKLPVYIYLTAISEFFFGLNTFAVRLPSVLAGIGTVIFAYLLVLELFSQFNHQSPITNHQSLATITALLVAIEPWSLFLSRGAFEANLSLFFIVSGVYFFLKGLHAISYLLPATILFGLSVWTYNSARIFVPLLMIVIIFIFRKDLTSVFKKNNRIFVYCLLLTVFFFLPMFYQLLNTSGQARYGEVAIIDQGAIAQIIEARQNSSFGQTITRLLYNRPVYFMQRFISNWASHFTCSFLFFKGGNNYQFSVPDHGLMYLVNLPFFFLGLLLLLKRVFNRDRISILLFSWLILAPIPSSLTREAPHVLRFIVMLPVPMIISAIGIIWVFNWIKDKKLKIRMQSTFLILYFLILSIYSVKYLNTYFNDYRNDFSRSWQYGYKEAVLYAKDNYQKYDKIVVTKAYGEPHEFFLFYWQWDPEAYRNDPGLNRFYQSNWYWVDRFDKFYFVNDWDIPTEEWQDFVLESGKVFKCESIPNDLKPLIEYDAEKCLLITSPGKVPKGWSKLETVNFLDGNFAFEIYEN
ncbi:hypothetical protein A2715_04745 [Candidatus Woesebacteria bacterium RIFCSPHIGHO2_01_FULL_39_32]|uniref:Glycosyltransferase RgtA/B/C/D-like domain-containing protein n=1 Tax=Candidatus Woesebacteria bacterium RIFCSPLOWO2_01_FULL_39_25 TaxID=1802521 RepID=A0A1F8BLB1_9BACT|nr:MAG: hypothetical protein A2715_04745 [Candidatus Woesebacteria bacterium RIFCSPHIGHO2_01_FULL_39_32]OGM37825.1 MAG: hypothetical protein A3F01_01955 [Candidatus Woesebacteria bacterium RIFCSPHIGHO2_12_FULL_38_11]OGM64857.1 MAG: hypothetical protein A2893_04355 [Candidatus Woesebacteria bacterium RIFCSPLOWO2_01_FULL_39_25]